VLPQSPAFKSMLLTLAGTDGGNARFSHESYYNSRPPSMMYPNRTEGSQHDLRQGGPVGGPVQRDTFPDQQSGYNNGYNPGPPNQGRRAYPRVNTEPQFPSAGRHQTNEYSIPNNQRSYETVASASGSGSSADPAGYQTDPTSSDNSSVDRVQAPLKRPTEPVNDYGIGFSPNLAYQPPAFTVGMGGRGTSPGEANRYQANPNGAVNGGSPLPPVPPKGQVLRKPTVNEYVQPRPAAPEKRKSWFARRFSKQG
jgi:hypothetical protein